MKKLYRFNWDCGRQGSVEGVFAAEDFEVEKAIGKMVYLGEILGKHSEIYDELGKDDLEVLTENQDFINEFESIVGDCGYNPLTYIRD